MDPNRILSLKENGAPRPNAAIVWFAATVVSPLAARSQPQGENMTSGKSSGTVPEATVTKAGAALRQVAEIKNVYAPKVQAAPTPDERVQVSKQEIAAATKAIGDQGLTVDEYNNVMELAQVDQDLRERLLKATISGH
jgi:hypothetical protein